MLTLTKRELTLLNQAQPDYTVYLTETEVNGNRWWAMNIEVTSQNKTYEVVTALGKTKLWRRLDIAIDFIKETCPRTKTVYVVFSP